MDTKGLGRGYLMIMKHIFTLHMSNERQSAVDFVMS